MPGQGPGQGNQDTKGRKDKKAPASDDLEFLPSMPHWHPRPDPANPGHGDTEGSGRFSPREALLNSRWKTNESESGWE